MFRMRFAAGERLLLTTLLGAGLCLANTQPLSMSNFNSNGAQLDTQVQATGSSVAYPVNFNFGSGGGFAATIDHTSTIMWCVDAQEDISLPKTYNADIVLLSQIPQNQNYVRYANVSSSSWYLPLSNATAQQRFEMAAYLIKNDYPGFPNGPSSSSLQAQEVQTAIWKITWNGNTSESGITSSQIADGGGALSSSADQQQVSDYVTAAETFVNTGGSALASLANSFAVISGPSDSLGKLSANGIQTYLVQVAPEPGYVMSLAVMFGLLAVFASRRKKALKQATNS